MKHDKHQTHHSITKPFPWVLAASLLLPGAFAFAQTPATAPTTPAAPMHSMTDSAGKTTPMAGGMHSGMDMKTMMKNMNDKMAGMAPSGNPDVDFAAMMRIHHLGALDMAEVQLRDGKNPQMRSMAKDIIKAQKKEIAIFDKFLAKNAGAATPMKK